MKYELIFSDQSKDDLSRLKRDEPQAFRKASKMLLELLDHPTTGTGKPELLIGSRSGKWSRRISQKHRLVYEILIQRFWYTSFRHGDIMMTNRPPAIQH